MKSVKENIILSIIAIAILVGGFLYFVTGITGTADPIRTYDYSGDINRLEKNMKALASLDSNFSYLRTDTTGNNEKGYGYYITFRFKNADQNLEYTICDTRTDNWFAKDKNVIEITEALDLTHLIGGYNSKAPVIEGLTGLFEKNILPQLIK